MKKPESLATNIEIGVLATYGAVRGVYEVYKPNNLQEKVETCALIGTVATFGYMIYKGIRPSE